MLFYFGFVLTVHGLDVPNRDLKQFRANFNESCNALDQAEKCETECFDGLVDCVVRCGTDNDCQKRCYREDILCGDGKRYSSNTVLVQ